MHVVCVWRKECTKNHAASVGNCSIFRFRGCNASAGTGYWTLADTVTHEATIQKSRFIALAWPVSSTTEAMQRVKEASDPSATHNCFAYKIGAEFRC